MHTRPVNRDENVHMHLAYASVAYARERNRYDCGITEAVADTCEDLGALKLWQHIKYGAIEPTKLTALCHVLIFQGSTL